jgi:hypothetical protein
VGRTHNTKTDIVVTVVGIVPVKDRGVRIVFLVHHLDKLIYRWVIRKYKKHGSNFKRSEKWVKRIKCKFPNYFVHWGLLRA